jgi:hypothetical protein
MTLIAATRRLEGIPVLFGDLLLTAPAKTGMSSFHPIQPGVAARLPQDRGRRIPGAARKAILINDHLAVGWAGSYFSAGTVLKSLLRKFGSSKHVDYADLESFLSTQDQYKENASSFHLVGWIFDIEHRCFRWNSQWPHELFDAPEHFEGTGEALFRSLLDSFTARRRGPGFKDSTELVPYVAATKMGRCIAEDVASGKLTTNYFGYGFETIFWDGLRYRFVDEITYVIKWQIAKLPNDPNFYTKAPALIVKYKAFKRYCIMQTIHCAGIVKDNIFVDMIVMPRDPPNPNAAAELRKEIPFSTKSPLYCSYVEVTVPGGQQASAPMVTTLGDEELFWITENGRTAPKLFANPKAVYWSLAQDIPGFLLRSPSYQ